MKKAKSAVLVAGCVLGVAGLIFSSGCVDSAMNILKANRVLRAAEVNPQMEKVFGAFSEGKIEFNDEGPNNSRPPEWKVDSPYRLDMKWAGLDLDGKGGSDDTVYFALLVTGTRSDFLSAAPVQANNEGWGIGNVWLGAGESIRIEMENVYLGAGTKGTILFEGFTSGQMIKASAPHPGRYVGEINGQEFKIDNSEARYSLVDVAFDPAESVIFSGKIHEGKQMLAAVRSFGLRFSYSK